MCHRDRITKSTSFQLSACAEIVLPVLGECWNEPLRPEPCASLLSLPPLQRNKRGRRLNPNRCWDLDAQMRQSCHRQRCVTRSFCRDRQNCASDVFLCSAFRAAPSEDVNKNRRKVRNETLTLFDLCSRPLFQAPLAGSNQTRQSTSFFEVIFLLFLAQSDVRVSQEDPFLWHYNGSSK